MSLNREQEEQLIKALQYDLLAQFYKYKDPKIHIMYYKKHLNLLEKTLDLQRNFSHTNHPAVIRIFHAVPDILNVDIYINEFKILTDFPYRDISHSLALPSGKYQLDIYPTGDQVSTILSKKVIVEHGRIYTFVITGSTEKLNILSVENYPSVPLGETKIRFIHLAKDVPAIDFAATYGDVVFPNVEFKQTTNYLGITPMTVDLEARVAGTKEVILAMKKMRFKPNRAYTVALIGLNREDSPIEAIILKEYFPSFS